MKAYISQLIKQSIQEISPSEAEQVLETAVFDVSYPKAEFGDYASNSAMMLFKNFNTKPASNPMEFAEQLAQKCLDIDGGNTFSKIEAASGFINFTLSEKQLAHNVVTMLEDIGIEQIGSGKKVVFEYSSPNTNKALHIGHTRNDVYGKACINLLKAVGYDVTTCEIINDRGIHIMKSLLMYLKHGNNTTPQSEGLKPDHFVGKFYAMFGSESSKSEEIEKQLLEEAQELLRKWEDGDPETRKVWKQMNDWFFEGVQQTYQKEGTTFDEVDFESEIFDKGKDLVLAGVEKGIFQKEEDGSVSLDLEEEKLGKKYLLRGDGTTLYITQDMYLWDVRNKRHNPDMALVTTSSEQGYHFAVLKKVFELLEYPWAKNFQHLPYEHVYLGQSKMSSRGGNTVSADELLQTVKDKVKQTMAELERLKGSTDNEELIEQIAFGAIKYGYLKYEPNTRIYFDIDQTISLQGNTGPYVQYAVARINSILKKVESPKTLAPQDLQLPEERLLMRKLLQFNDVVVMAAKEYKPNLLCNYLLELAQAFHAFYAVSSVTNAENESVRNQRVTVLLATSKILQQGLGLLGIASPEEM
jgi:arginyl-tRNA synthetase